MLLFFLFYSRLEKAFNVGNHRLNKQQIQKESALWKFSSFLWIPSGEGQTEKAVTLPYPKRLGFGIGCLLSPVASDCSLHEGKSGLRCGLSAVSEPHRL